jgi:hypothetical protein
LKGSKRAEILEHGLLVNISTVTCKYSGRLENISTVTGKYFSRVVNISGGQ